MVHNPGGDWNPGWGVDLSYYYHSYSTNGKLGCFGLAGLGFESRIGLPLRKSKPPNAPKHQVNNTWVLNQK